MKGGLVNVQLDNRGKAPHGAQFIRIEGDHTAQEALKTVASNSDKTPGWLHAAGGLGSVAPGLTAAGTVQLLAGRYVVADVGGPGSSGPPASKDLTVTSGPAGTPPSTATTITAAEPSKDHYQWQLSGALKPGANRVTFVSKGDEALHFIGAFRVTGNPSKAKILEALKSQGRPPSFVDQSSFYTSAVLDGGRSQITPLNLRKPGKYVVSAR